MTDIDKRIDEKWEKRLAELQFLFEQTIKALAAKNEHLQAQVAELRKAQWYYVIDDAEYGSDDINAIVHDSTGRGEAILVAGARKVFTKWFIELPITLDEDGDFDESEVKGFETQQEALDAYQATINKAGE